MVELTYLKTPLNKYTFKSKSIKNWVESHCKGKRVLNLFAGQIHLDDCIEIRNDADVTMNADFHLDALTFVQQWYKEPFDVVILDPPYSYRKSMEMYNGHKASKFNQLKDYLKPIMIPEGEIITFGYQSNSMGKVRGTKQVEIMLMSHGGAIHDTIAVLERFI